MFIYRHWSTNRKQMFWVLVFIVIIAIAQLVATNLNARATTLKYIAPSAAAEEVPAALAPDVIATMKGEILDTLAKCESPGDTAVSLPVIEDNNQYGTLARREVPSIGTFRFKIGTVIGYEKMRSGKELNAKEATLLALDDTEARKLAEYIAFETPEGDKGIRNWLNCSNKHDLQTLVNFIKSHE